MAAADEQAIKLAIEMRNRAADAIGQSVRDLARWQEELKRAKAAADGSSESNRRLGEAMIAHREALNRQREALRGALGGTSQFAEAQQHLRGILVSGAQEMANQAGAAGRLISSFGGVGVAIGAAAGALTAFIGAAIGASRTIGDFQERQDLLGDQLGLTQKEIGGLTLAAANVGRSFDAIQPALFIFTRRLGEAREGSKEAIASFKALGVDAQRDLRGTGAILGDVAAQIDSVGDTARRNAILVDLFGRSGAQVLPILRQNLKAVAEEAERTGITLSESAQQTAREADRAWEQLGASFTGLRNTILVALAPIGTEIAKQINGMIREFRGLNDQVERSDFQKYIDELNRAGAEHRKLKADIDETTRALQRQAIEAREAPLQGPAFKLPPGAPERQTGASAGIGIPAVGNQSAIILQTGELLKGSRELTEEEAKRLKAQQEQLAQVRETIALMQFQRELLPELVPDEIKRLEAMRQQVRSREELVAIERELNRLYRERGVEELVGPPRPSDQPPDFRPVPSRPGFGPRGDERPVADREALKKLQKEHREAVAQTILNVNQGAIALRDFANSLRAGTRSVTASIAELVAGIGTLISAIGGNPVFGAVGALVSTIGGLFQSGGLVPAMATAPAAPIIRAQSGLVLSGTRGRDSVPAFLGRGEMVVSHAETEFIQRVLGRLDQTLSRTQTAPAQSNAISIAEGAINVTIQGSGLAVPDLRRAMSEGLADELVRHLSRRLG